jgi:hypothetical protein
MIGSLALLGACSTESTTAGGGGFTGETISGIVVGVSGKGVAGASVRLRASDGLTGVALRETSTDSTGRFRLEPPVGYALRLEVAGVERGDSVRALVDLDPGQSPGRILAEAPPPRVVRLRDGAGTPVVATLEAYGLGRVVATDDSGRVDLSAWPAADIWARATTANGGVFDLFVSQQDIELELRAGWLVDDFEGRNNRNRLGSLIGGGWWYVAAQGADSQTAGDIAAMRDTLDAHGGRSSLRAGFAFSSAFPKFGLVGFHFGARETDPVDLSGLDSLVFYAKGTGTMRVEFVSDTGGGVTSHAVLVPLGPNWTSHVVASSALAPIDAGRRWSLDAKRVRFLQFIVFETADFRLDDLRYHGRELPGRRVN